MKERGLSNCSEEFRVERCGVVLCERIRYGEVWSDSHSENGRVASRVGSRAVPSIP